MTLSKYLALSGPISLTVYWGLALNLRPISSGAQQQAGPCGSCHAPSHTHLLSAPRPVFLGGPHPMGPGPDEVMSLEPRLR